jgi:hypothetical protein
MSRARHRNRHSAFETVRRNNPDAERRMSYQKAVMSLAPCDAEEVPINFFEDNLRHSRNAVPFPRGQQVLILPQRFFGNGAVTAFLAPA